jgi:hypothetical protein
MNLGSPRAGVDFRLLAAAGAFVACVGVQLGAQSPSCTTYFTAPSKLFDKPFHLYMIDSAQTDARLHGGQPRVSESIWTGTADYVLVRGKWRKGPVDIAEMRKMKDTVETTKRSCSQLREESVNGEPAVVWRIHSQSEAGTNDTDVWIAKNNGLLLKSDVHQDVGGAFGKSHIVSRYEYTNVGLPAGVQ